MKFFPPKTLELTLALIKPHAALIPPVVQEIKQSLFLNNFLIVRWKRSVIPMEVASQLYAVHKEKPFYGRLVSMMTSGPVESFILAREDAIKHWRTMMGPTRTYQAQYTDPHSQRGKFGISNTRNATHGSDSPESVQSEAYFIFPDFDLNRWYSMEEIYFRNGFIKFDEIDQIHKIEEKDAPKAMYEQDESDC